MTPEELTKISFDQRVDWAIGEIAMGIGRGDTKATMSRILNAMHAIAFQEVREMVKTAQEPPPSILDFAQQWLNQIQGCVDENDLDNARAAEMSFWNAALMLIAHGGSQAPVALARLALASKEIKFQRNW